MKKGKIILGALLISAVISSAIPMVSKASIEDEMRERVTSAYNNAKALKGVNNFYNICPSLTAYQMISLGIVERGQQNDYLLVNADGKNWYSFYAQRNGNKTSKGYTIECFGGANGLQQLVNTYGSPLYNIVVSFDGTNTNAAGHVMFIHAIIDGKIYFTDNAPQYEGKLVIKNSVSDFMNMYKQYNGYTSQGAVYFSKNQEGWKNFNGEYKYLNNDGNYAIGWKEVNGYWYYFNKDGVMETGFIDVDGNIYYLYDSGAMAIGWINIGKNYYYATNGGALIRNACRIVNNIDYEFDNNGIASEVKQEKPTQEESKDIDTTKKTKYSYRTRELSYEYTTSTEENLDGWDCIDIIKDEGYSSWSDWSEEYVDENEAREVQTRQESSGSQAQIYLGRYYSESKNNFSPQKLDSSYMFEGGWFDESSVNFIGQAYAGGRTDCYKVDGYHYYFFEIGSNGGERREISTGSRTQYRYRTKTGKTSYKYCRPKYSNWSEWSEWSDTPMESNDLTEVKTTII